MNEKKKLWIILGGILLLVLLIVLLAINNTQKSKKLYEEFEKAFNSSENALIYIGRPTCKYCTLLQPSLDEMSDRYDFNYVYINIDDFSSTYFNQVMEKLGIKEIGTPYLAIVKDGKVIAKNSDNEDKTLNGYMDYDKLFGFLQNNGIIAEDAKLNLNYIGYDDYAKLLAGSEKSVIVIGQSTCGYCIQAKLILNKLADEKSVKINYVNVSYFSEEQGKNFEKSLEYFSGEWGTPVMMIVQDGKMVDVLENLNSQAKYEEFLKKNGVL